MIISFAWTTPALLAGAKTVTRREWSPRHARLVRPGAIVDAWDRTPRVPGSRRVAQITIRDVVEERGVWIPSDDIFHEGIMWSKRHGIAIPDGYADWNAWWTDFRIRWHRGGGYRVEFALVNP